MHDKCMTCRTCEWHPQTQSPSTALPGPARPHSRCSPPSPHSRCSPQAPSRCSPPSPHSRCSPQAPSRCRPPSALTVAAAPQALTFAAAPGALTVAAAAPQVPLTLQPRGRPAAQAVAAVAPYNRCSAQALMSGEDSSETPVRIEAGRRRAHDHRRWWCELPKCSA